MPGGVADPSEMAVRLQPYGLFFQTWRAVCLFWAGQVDAAIRHLRDIVALSRATFWRTIGWATLRPWRVSTDEAREAAARACDVSGATKALAGLGW